MDSLLRVSTKRLRARGGRLTPQRRLILEALQGMNSHPTAEELYESVRKRAPNLNLSTVYRTLRWLEEEGLVSVRRFEEENRQERFDPALPSEHHHFMCTNCRQVTEFDSQLIESIRIQFEGHTQARVETAVVILYGLCFECQQALSTHTP